MGIFRLESFYLSSFHAVLSKIQLHNGSHQVTKFLLLVLCHWEIGVFRSMHVTDDALFSLKGPSPVQKNQNSTVI
jgi:hypothetical protein